MSKRTPSDVIEELLHQMGYKGTYMGMASLATGRGAGLAGPYAAARSYQGALS